MIEFRVYGIPKPGGSKSFMGMSKSGHAILKDASNNKAWRTDVKAAAIEAMNGREPFTTPLRLAVKFIMPRGKGHYGTGKNAKRLKPSAPHFHTFAPDATKCLRSTEDAMTGIVWRDDSQIAVQSVTKIYGDLPGALIEVEELTVGRCPGCHTDRETTHVVGTQEHPE